MKVNYFEVYQKKQSALLNKTNKELKMISV